MSRITVFVSGLEFYGYHGVLPEERKIGNRFTLDLDVELESSAVDTDAIQDSVDYSALSATALRVSGEQPVHTVERLANLIGQAVLDEFPKVKEVTLRLAKLAPPMPYVVVDVGVILTLSR